MGTTKTEDSRKHEIWKRVVRSKKTYYHCRNCGEEFTSDDEVWDHIEECYSLTPTEYFSTDGVRNE